MQKLKKSYLLYGTESYISVLTECAKSIRQFSDEHILIYLINSDKRIDIVNTTTINWDMDLYETDLYTEDVDGNFYIKREKNDIYRILTERVKILKDALINRSEIVVYIDSDSIATHNIDRIFELYKNEPFVMATEGIYDWMHVGTRGGSMDPNDLSTTLEHPACELFNVNQYVRQRYRTTNLFIAGQNSLNFIDEWIYMCSHPEVIKNPEWYAAYHEETLYNVLLWKYNLINGLPYLYMNGSTEDIKNVYNKYSFPEDREFISEWKRIPLKEEDLLVFHGEKRIEKMKEMKDLLIKNHIKLKRKKGHFDFIEIGTSDFDTLIQNCENNELGLSIEPLQDYLNSLPNKDNVVKICTAISDYDGEVDIYNIPLHIINSHNLPIWVKGCNSLNSPHEFTRNKLGTEYYDSIVSINKVKIMTWDTLIYSYNINSIKYLKIDTEGHDYIILKSYFEVCEKKPYLLADKILFEYNGFNKKELDNLVSSLTNYAAEYLEDNILLTKKNNIIKILYLAPHLSTGGMPAFLLKRIQSLKGSDVEITVVEYSNHSDDYVVQKNQIKKLCDNFYTLGENKLELIDIIKRHQIDVVHVEEMVEDGHNNFPSDMLNELYDNDRTWKIVETCHNIVFKPDIEKRYHPDSYIFCTPFHLDTFKNMQSKKYVIEYPIENKIPTSEEKLESKKLLGLDPTKKHVLNVGLWTQGKNQKEGVEMAKSLPNVEFHFVGNQAGNFIDYWSPIMKNIPKNVKVWGERNDVDNFMKACDVFLFNSTWECNPLVIREAASYGLPILTRNLPQYVGMFDEFITPLNEKNKISQLRDLLKIENKSIYEKFQYQTEVNFKEKHINSYKEVIKSNKIHQKININIHFVNHPFLEITGPSNKTYLIQYFDDNNILIYQNRIKSYHWVKLNREWFTNWKIKVWEDDKLIFDYNLNLENKRVYIAFDSSSLGDTIAWLPYAEEFRKKHNCHVIVSTYKNFLFEKSYPKIEFVSPGTRVDNLFAMYSIGWFYDMNKEPILPNIIPLQKAATNILGLQYEEIRPKIDFTPKSRPIKNKYVTIATNSTAGCKFWTKEGWQELIDYLHQQGYSVINVSKEENPFKNCTQIKDKSMENTMNYIHHSEFFIGLSSGLSWLAWAMNKQVVMISNFTEPNHEFECLRVTKTNVCNGCWNSPKYKFDKSWNWCPIYSGTEKMFECQTSILGSDVINLIKKNKLV